MGHDVKINLIRGYKILYVELQMNSYSEVCLRIGGYMEEDGRIGGEGIDPEFCTKLLEIIPDKQWRKGDLFGIEYGASIKRRINLWMYSTKNRIKNDSPCDLLPHLRHIIKIFGGKSAQFNRMRNMGDVKISIFITSVYTSVTYTLDRLLIEDILELGVDEVKFDFIGIKNEVGSETNSQN